MKASHLAIVLMSGLAAAMPAFAGTANSSASASSNGRGPGTAVATAGYDGNGIGIARTNTKSGSINLAQGLSVGFDEDGLSLSSSFAVAPRSGPAAAGTFNLAVGLDGSVSHSVGRTVASGDRSRSVEAGGSVSPGSHGRSGTATATANGRTGPRGQVLAQTSSHTSRPKVIRHERSRPIMRRR